MVLTKNAKILSQFSKINLILRIKYYYFEHFYQYGLNYFIAGANLLVVTFYHSIYLPQEFSVQILSFKSPSARPSST